MSDGSRADAFREQASAQSASRPVEYLKDWRGSLRRLHLKVRWKAVRALAPRRTVFSRGLQFTLHCDNWILYRRWQTFNEKDPETLDWIDHCLQDGDTFFDVGANVGIYSIYAALRHPRLRVVAFEPEYANLHTLRDNVIENHLQDRVQIFALALSDQSGVSRLHIQEFLPGAALHTESPGTLEQTLMGRQVLWWEGVCTLTMDEFCEQTGLQPQGLKIDVDGTEARVLEGGLHTLQSTALRSLIIELQEQDRQQCEELLRAAGWQCQPARVPRSLNVVWTRVGWMCVGGAAQ